MTKARIFDIVFILFAFIGYIIMLNLDEQLDQCNVVCRHFWLPLVIAYYVGRFVSVYTGKKGA